MVTSVIVIWIETVWIVSLLTALWRDLVQNVVDHRYTLDNGLGAALRTISRFSQKIAKLTHDSSNTLSRIGTTLRVDINSGSGALNISGQKPGKFSKTGKCKKSGFSPEVDLVIKNKSPLLWFTA